MQKPEVSLSVDPRTLTTREREVLTALAQGRTNREIASLLGISAKTVDTHRGKALKKLGLRNNADLTRYAIKHGLIDVDGAVPSPVPVERFDPAAPQTTVQTSS